MYYFITEIIIRMNYHITAIANSPFVLPYDLTYVLPYFLPYVTLKN